MTIQEFLNKAEFLKRLEETGTPKAIREKLWETFMHIFTATVLEQGFGQLPESDRAALQRGVDVGKAEDLQAFANRLQALLNERLDSASATALLEKSIKMSYNRFSKLFEMLEKEDSHARSKVK